jgi:hypothetical protein
MRKTAVAKIASPARAASTIASLLRGAIPMAIRSLKTFWRPLFHFQAIAFSWPPMAALPVRLAKLAEAH